jgi:hypothetical protein
MMDNKKIVMVRSVDEFVKAIEMQAPNEAVVIDEADSGKERQGMSVISTQLADRIARGQRMLNRLDLLKEAQKKEDKARLMLLKKEKQRFPNKVGKQSQRR